MTFGTDQDSTENHNRDDEAAALDRDMARDLGEDAPLTPSDEAHAKHAAAVALGNPSVTPPPADKPKRAPRKDAGKPRKPKASDAIETRHIVGGAGVGEPIQAEATPVVEIASPVIGRVVGVGDFVCSVDDVHSPEVHYDHKAIAKARLKVYGKFASRARAAAKLWPNDPARYFDVVGKIFTDLALGECKVDALRHDRPAVTDLVMGLLPKSTLEVIDCSGITVI